MTNREENKSNPYKPIDIDKFQKEFDKLNKVCPHCGRCPECGRRYNDPLPWNPWKYIPDHMPYVTWSDSDTSL